MCPVCGLHHSIRNYEPENLPLDIEAVLKVGLGRGKGTKVVDRFSLLSDDDVSPKIVKRVLTLCNFFLNQKLITHNDLKHSLGIIDAPQPSTVSLWEYNKLNEDKEALKVNLEIERKNFERESSRADNLQVTVNSLQRTVKKLETQLSNSKSLRASMKKDLDELEAWRENFLDEIIETIEERTEFVYKPSEESKEIFIDSVMSKLLEDMEASIADDDKE
jgi:hypothetical protein